MPEYPALAKGSLVEAGWSKVEMADWPLLWNLLAQGARPAYV
jgi:hypothetical protein